MKFGKPSRYIWFRTSPRIHTNGNGNMGRSYQSLAISCVNLWRRGLIILICIKIEVKIPCEKKSLQVTTGFLRALQELVYKFHFMYDAIIYIYV